MEGFLVFFPFMMLCLAVHIALHGFSASAKS
jgi:hypothetical protein